MSWAAKAHTSPLLGLCPRAHGPQLLKSHISRAPCPSAREATTAKATHHNYRKLAHPYSPCSIAKETTQ